MKKVMAFAIACLLLVGGTSDVFAKKLLPQMAAAKAKAAKGVVITVKFLSGKRGITATFTNVNLATKIDYLLSYKTNGIEQGSKGTITPGTPTTEVREFLFGTCSKGVCRYDTNITDAKFVVTTYLKTGKKVIKTFKLKI